MLAAGVAPADAADSVPFSDAQSIGTITLYDAAGHVVTHGSSAVSLRTEVARAVGSGPPPDGRVQGVYLSIWVPHSGSADASAWSGAPLSLTTVLAPSAKNLPATTQPLDVWPLERDLIEASGPSAGAVAGYYELRLYGVNDGPDISPQYYTAAIKIDSSAHTWTMLNSPVPVGQSSSGSSGASSASGSGAASGAEGGVEASAPAPGSSGVSVTGGVAGSGSGAASGPLASGATAARGAPAGAAGSSGSAATAESGLPQTLALRSSSTGTSVSGPAALAVLFLAVDSGLLVRARRRGNRFARHYRNGA